MTFTRLPAELGQGTLFGALVLLSDLNYSCLNTQSRPQKVKVDRKYACCADMELACGRASTAGTTVALPRCHHIQ